VVVGICESQPVLFLLLLFGGVEGVVRALDTVWRGGEGDFLLACFRGGGEVGDEFVAGRDESGDTCGGV
jgi:hypothetical protein